MKKQIKIFSILLLFASAGLFSACEDMLDTNSDRLVPEEGNNLGSPNDTVFSILGILSEVQKLSDRYILFGELRADLLDVTENTNSDLREINDLMNIRPDNPYLGVSDYYSVINNCNYFIHHVDTTLKSQGIPLMLKEYGLAKTIRAWAYMQLSLNYGSVPFYLEPITRLDQSEKDYPRKNIREIAAVLIEDLEPCVGYGLPVYGNIDTGIGDFPSEYYLFPIRFVLGDLYMWKGESEADFAAAAYHYAMLINQEKYLSERYIQYTSSSFLYYVDVWSGAITGELITVIPLAIEPTKGRVGYIRDLLGYTQDNYGVPQIIDSELINRMWEEQIYAYVTPGSSSTVAITTNGDLRQKGSVYKDIYSGLSQITKLNTAYNYVSIYRTGLLYLRYAEAVNFAGKPALAFAVLKYGLKPDILLRRSIIPAHELETGSEYIDIFRSEIFDENIGIHSRGCGRSDLNTSYVLPSGLQTRMDSIESVSGFILNELALETAFEGNRFYDLMRFSRNLDDNYILADAIALKHVGKELQIQAFLSDSKNWYLPLPDKKEQ